MYTLVIREGKMEIPAEMKQFENDTRTPSVVGMTAGWGCVVQGSIRGFHDSSFHQLFNEDYRDVAEAAFNGFPPIYPYKVKIVNRDYPITRDGLTFETNRNLPVTPANRAGLRLWQRARLFSVSWRRASGDIPQKECITC
jgi:hypothetical protein